MSYKANVQRYLHARLTEEGMKHFNKLERFIDYRSIGKYIAARKRRGVDDATIETYITGALAKGEKNGCRGQFYTSGILMRMLRGIGQFFSRSTGYDLHIAKRLDALKKAASDYANHPVIGGPLKEYSAKVEKLTLYREPIQELRGANLMSGRRAENLERRIETASERMARKASRLIYINTLKEPPKEKKGKKQKTAETGAAAEEPTEQAAQAMAA